MRYFQNTGLLLIYCLFAVLYTDVNFIFIFCFLCALILGCSGFFVRSRNLRCLFSLLFLGAACLFPTFFCFFPMPVYILLREDLKPAAAAGILFYGYHFAFSPAADRLSLVFGIFAFLLTLLLQHHASSYETLSRQFHQTQDEGRENNLLLSEKNKTLLEKQDYEIYAATLKERNRIAREIHDNVGHILSRSILMVGAAKAVNQDTGLTPLLENIDHSLNSAMDSIRSSVHDLHDESVNLEEVIRSLIRDFSFCPAELEYDMGPEVPRDIKYCFISITREGLTNIMKHSSASRVRVVVREHPALYQLFIKDNGDTAKLSSTIPDSGIGIKNMRERVGALGGTLQITTENGFKIFISVPKLQRRADL